MLQIKYKRLKRYLKANKIHRLFEQLRHFFQITCRLETGANTITQTKLKQVQHYAKLLHRKF